MIATLETIIGTHPITFNLLDRVRTTIINLPRRNIQKYRSMPLKEVISTSVPDADKISSRSANEYIKTFNAILTFGHQRGYTEREFKLKVVKINASARNDRKALSLETINHLINTAQSTELRDSYTLLYLSGMRLSEAYKCKVTVVDGITCFDLRDCTDLKTSVSRRLIPVHKSIDPFKALEAIRNMKPNYVSKQASKVLTNEGESLYSLRHSFATNLVNNGADANVVSELMGHSHKTMTLNRYAKGYKVTILYETVLLL